MRTLAEEIQHAYKVNLPLFPGSLDSARRLAEEEAKYLMIYLHCPTHASTQAFLKTVLGDDEVIARFSEQVVLYGSSVMETEGWQLCQELQVTTFPCLVVILKKSIVMKLQGPYTKAELLAEWDVCTSSWDGVVAEEISVRFERQQRDAARHAEESAAREMELADMARLDQLEAEDRRRAAELEAAREQQRRKDAEAAAQQRLEEERQALEREKQAQGARRRQAALAALPPEPSADSPAASTALISLKSLSGKQHQRRFLRTDCVDCIMQYAESLEEHENEEDMTLVCGFPPKLLAWTAGQTTVGEVPDLCPRAMVIVRRRA